MTCCTANGCVDGELHRQPGGSCGALGTCRNNGLGPARDNIFWASSFGPPSLANSRHHGLGPARAANTRGMVRLLMLPLLLLLLPRVALSVNPPPPPPPPPSVPYTSYVGCYQDDGSRNLINLTFGYLTVEQCSVAVQQAGFYLFALQDAQSNQPELGVCIFDERVPVGTNQMASPADLASWGPGGDPCTYHWVGVECSEDSKVTKLVLDGIPSAPNAAPALIPTRLSELTTLTHLEVSNAEMLVGTLPEQWSTLTRLHHLQVSNTNAVGLLPPAWSSLTSLTSLTISNCASLNSALPPEWSSLDRLITIQLNSNQLEGGLAQEWSALASLEQLGLASNKLSSSIPMAWGARGSLPALISIDLSKNADLCGLLPSNPSIDNAAIDTSGA
eukprot:gene17140-23445_t